MSRKDYFDNPYPDYSPEAAKNFIENGQLKKDCRMVIHLEKKWKDTEARLNNLDEVEDYSIYTGLGGIIMLKLLKYRSSKKHLEELLESCLENFSGSSRRWTFLTGKMGLAALIVVIANELGLEDAHQKIEKQLTAGQSQLTNSEDPDVDNEYLYGRVGYMFGYLYVNKMLGFKKISSQHIKDGITSLLKAGRNGAKRGNFQCPLWYEWHQKYYLGAAHGLAGILYFLLQAKDYLTETELNNDVRPTIDYLISLKFPSGNWPSSVGNERDTKVQWCHGAPGFVHLYCQAYKVFGDAKYLQLAQDAGDVIWRRGLLRKGYSLCHGVSGNAYSFLELYQTTKEEKYLYRALRFAEWCLDYNTKHEEHYPDRPLSLYEGICGPMYLLLDIQKPLEAKFPGYTL